MPRITARLSDAKLRNAQPKEKPYKLHDGEGLFLLVRPTGKKAWQMLYQHGGKHNTYTIGQYPDIGAADARRIRDDIKAQLREGINPNKTKQTRRMENMGQSETNFETIAREWLEKQIWVEKHKKNITRTFEADVFPKIGYMQIDKIMPKDTGSISRLSGRGTGELSVKEHGPHVDSRAKPEQAFVALTFKIVSLNKEATITRTVKAPSKPTITPDDPDIQAAIGHIHAFSRRHCR